VGDKYRGFPVDGRRRCASAEVAIVTSPGDVASHRQRAAPRQRPGFAGVGVPPPVVNIDGNQAGSPKLAIHGNLVFGDEFDLCTIWTLGRPEERCSNLAYYDCAGFGAS
jgi:hypothetical protein